MRYLNLLLIVVVLFSISCSNSKGLLWLSTNHSKHMLYNNLPNQVYLHNCDKDEWTVVFDGDTLAGTDGVYQLDLSGDNARNQGQYSIRCYTGGRLIETFAVEVVNGHLECGVGNGFHHSDSIPLSHFMVMKGVVLNHKQPNVNCTVNGYKFQAIRKDSLLISEYVEATPLFNESIQSYQSDLIAGDMIIISDVKGQCASIKYHEVPLVVYYLK